MDGDRIRSSPELVGRDASLDQIVAVLARRRAGMRTVVVAGEAGVGKTRLAEAASEVLAQRGVDAFAVHVSPAMGSLPLGALAAVVPIGPSERRSDLLVGASDGLLAARDRLLVVDDAHLVDPTTAAVLHLAVTTGRAEGAGPRLLLTVRSDEPAEPSIVALWKDGLADRVDLGPLERSATDRIAERLLGAPLDGVSSAELWEASRGNPLFVRELLVGALDEGLVERRGPVHSFVARPRASARLGELLAARLDDVDVAAGEVLDLLAVAGSLGLDHLRRLAGGDDVLAELERAGLVRVEVDGQRRPVRLAHPLYGEVVRARMGKIRELAVYRSLADELEAFGARRRNDVLDLARWRLLGGGEARPDTMLRGARQALARFDAHLALELVAAARRHRPGVEADLVEAAALEQLGRHRDAAAVLERAVDAASEDAPVVSAATALSVIEFWTDGDAARARATVASAVERVDDPVAARRLEAHAASFAAMSNRPTEAIRAVEPHLADDADPVAFTIASLAAGPALTVAGRALDAIGCVERALPVRLAFDDEAAMPDAFKYEMGRAFALSEAGLLDRAGEVATSSYELAASTRAVSGVAWAAMLRGRVLAMIGDVGEAADAFVEAAELFDRLDEPGLRWWSLAGCVIVAAMRGDAATAATARTTLDAIDPGPVVAMQADVDRARAWACRVAGDLATAEAILAASVAEHDARGAWGMSLALVHDLVRIGSPATAAALVRQEHLGVQGELATCRLALVDGAATDDAAALEHSASVFAGLGSRVFAAEAWALASTAHRTAGSARAAVVDANAARELVGHRRVRTPPIVALRTTVLTAREREVAELAARGRSSREIAVQLDRSVRTVENHLQRVYDKLGIDGRSELAGALA